MCWCLPVIVGFLIVGLLYLVCFVSQWLHGWPDKPGYKKYIEALNPRRIYRLTFTMLDLLKYFKYLRLYFQIKSWYKNEENSKHFKKDIVYGRRGNKLDLYYPPKMKRFRDELPPLVVFIYGGAWSTGDRSIYCLLARQMVEELNAAVVCPNYSNYPKGNVLMMIQDVADCLVWAQENGQKFSFDKDNIVLVGHSAGAHLGAMATLFLLDTREELLIESKQQQEIIRSLRGVIGLSGVYSIMDHYEHEKMRGIEYMSCMSRAMNGEENFPRYSPAHVVKSLNGDKLSRAPRFVLLHSESDIVVPVESSTKFYMLLSSLSAKVSLHLLPTVSHTDIVIDLMLSSRRFYHPISECIKLEFRKLLFFR
ncbi:probable isoprenylcysteine alpha-carbonyl methylesterase ICMEL2 [Fundulus heteroclitus]|uniref:probable isoprenylcysteine alpha-carbonyl methylesterase ICMEL2 n=1 Tax=Fundulus heteroclitus TaxID=8078 RepID=UPI00165C2563|nr:probable isoprenylcysteine alpha-carbonyl methylesterase ICMEL2 [Fundulus heteroclitus]XP_035999897.1 probable isoprenylcysteine alpha-carbonyl methylesterase ICMEL2 [Fundulus heteroclitus]